MSRYPRGERDARTESLNPEALPLLYEALQAACEALSLYGWGVEADCVRLKGEAALAAAAGYVSTLERPGLADAPALTERVDRMIASCERQSAEIKALLDGQP